MNVIVKFISAFAISATILVGCEAEPDGQSTPSTWTLTDGGWWATVTKLPPTPVPGDPPKPPVISIGSDLLFEFGSSRLTASAQNVIAGVTAELLASGASVRIGGHADVLASNEAANEKIGRERAHEVAEAMIAAGFPRDRIVGVEGHGSAQPRALPADTPSNRALNRRVEIERAT